MKEKYTRTCTILLCGILLTCITSACSSKEVRLNASGTQVDLSKNNYRVVHANATGSSTGFKILGIVPVVSPSYTDAVSDLYRVTSSSQGKARALANFAHEDSSTYLLLFSLPKIKVRADIIEFTESNNGGSFRNSDWPISAKPRPSN